MREIKFRVWDKKLKKMFNYELVISNYASHEQLPYPTLVGIGNFKEELINNPSDLMQFTGLLDMNGKEIYEGDILVATASDGNGGDLTYSKKEVVFYEGAFQMKELLDPTWGMDYMDDISDLEVIGNIYEGENK